MRYQTYLTEGSTITSVINQLVNLGYNKASKILSDTTKKLLQLLIDRNLEAEGLAIINKHLHTHFKSLKEIARVNHILIKEDTDLLNEDLKHYWSFIESQAWGGLVFYPMLQLYLELDKLLSDGDINIKKVITYTTIFLFIMSAKHIQLFNKWKKESPTEWELEGRPNAFIGKKGIRPEVKAALQQDPTSTRTTGKLGFKLN